MREGTTESQYYPSYYTNQGNTNAKTGAHEILENKMQEEYFSIYKKVLQKPTDVLNDPGGETLTESVIIF